MKVVSCFAQGPLIYVNYGQEEDYALLERMGVSVSGAVVIMRYSKVSRSSKVSKINHIISCCSLGRRTLQTKVTYIKSQDFSMVDDLCHGSK